MDNTKTPPKLRLHNDSVDVSFVQGTNPIFENTESRFSELEKIQIW